MKVNFIANKKFKNTDVLEFLKMSSDQKKFTNDGPVKKLLEYELKNILNIPENKSVVCLSNGTTALHTLLYSFEIKNRKKLKWMTPSFTFPTPMVGGFKSNVGLVCESGRLLKDSNLNDIDGLIITSIFGSSLDIEYWVDRCKEENKILILDNASSPCSLIKKESIMSYGDASFSSLHHTKFLGVGEGGFVVVEEEIAELINKIACFGFDQFRKYDSRSSNFKMSDITAAYILSHVKNYDIEKHKSIQNELVNFVDLIGLKTLGSCNDIVYGNLPVIFNKKIDKSFFTNLNVEVNKYYRPLIEEDFNAWEIYERIINFPLHDELTLIELDILKDVLRISSENQ
jgi:dTDP-4-amino-4,6-dideoxygalactose transaminase